MIFVTKRPCVRSGASRRWSRAFVATALSAFAVSVASMDVKVTITNNTAKPVTNVASSFGFPQSIPAWGVRTFTIYAGRYSSRISADYASGQTQGGCRFEVGHTMNSIGPLYTSTGRGYGNVLDPFCFVYVVPKWSAPYRYDVKMMISQ
ncbi:hypothetical protein [Luteibacter sp. UNCMF366Tsu5.1]|uniref:hypothetical protein n=1 Tax=Luteibacter sp. UNCMF366Tsu5.1 TaxID=1502758 RepID=UPI000908CC78|nr:hypothetical protein [Luteibacter sp. UNCMF366Tsu5.1]SFW70747.1 hypothetical protein SAMN02800691_3151 [Luteibacter sp. UNCMF366Tsu5.1]